MLDGFHYILLGFSLICKPGLRRFVIIPLLLNICLFILSFEILYYFMKELNIWVMHFLPTWLQWMSIFLWLLFFLGFLFFIVYAYVMVANLVSAPFNSLLAEKVEFYITGIKPKQHSWLDLAKDTPRMIGRQLMILVYYLPRLLVVVLLFFIPLVHFLAPLLAFLLNAWFMTFTYVDYPSDNHKIPLSDVRSWLRQHTSTSLGFGFSVLVFTMIPILNCLVIPAAVAGATQFCLDKKLIQ